MAVPKKKTSSSKRNMRRRNNSKIRKVVFAQRKGKYNLSHHLCEKDGYYDKEKLISDKKKKNKKFTYTELFK